MSRLPLLAAFLALTLLTRAPVTAGPIQYVVATPGGPAEYTLWTSYTASVNCARALLYGSDPRQWMRSAQSLDLPGRLDH